MSTYDDDISDDDLRERAAEAESAAAEVRRERSERAKALRAQGMSFRDIATRLGVSVATAHADAAEPTTDDWIRAQWRGQPADTDSADDWIRAQANRGAWARRQALQNHLSGATEGDTQ